MPKSSVNITEIINLNVTVKNHTERQLNDTWMSSWTSLKRHIERHLNVTLNVPYFTLNVIWISPWTSPEHHIERHPERHFERRQICSSLSRIISRRKAINWTSFVSPDIIKEQVPTGKSTWTIFPAILLCDITVYFDITKSIYWYHKIDFVTSRNRFHKIDFLILKIRFFEITKPGYRFFPNRSVNIFINLK